MIPVTLAELRDLTGGELHGASPAAAAELVIDGPVVTDSRDAARGGLYIARVGESTDGHRFVPDARDRGAVAALTSRPVDGLPAVVVADVQAAFAALARSLVDRREGLTVIGLTGSSGKTTTKDLLGTVLATAGETVAPIGSYNSEVGLPLTVCRITPTTRFLVAEMGARGIGHIAYLTAIAPPDIAVVLNVGQAHVGEFGSRAAIATAKGELVEALRPDGVAVLNADDPAVRAMAARTAARVVLVGEAADAEVRATDIVLDGLGRASFTVHCPTGTAEVRPAHHIGRHHVANTLAALAVALECGLGLEQACAAASAAAPVSRWRMELTETDGVLVVNDAYNANPDSMRAALAALAAITGRTRKWAVLGTMLELGAESADDHAEIGREAVRSGVDQLLVVGAEAEPMAAAARAAATDRPLVVRHVSDADAAYEILRHELDAGDAVLFKSSRDAGLRWLGDRISGRLEESA